MEIVNALVKLGQCSSTSSGKTVRSYIFELFAFDLELLHAFSSKLQMFWQHRMGKPPEIFPVRIGLEIAFSRD
jgi:hypothetical protein